MKTNKLLCKTALLNTIPIYRLKIFSSGQILLKVIGNNNEILYNITTNIEDDKVDLMFV